MTASTDEIKTPDPAPGPSAEDMEARRVYEDQVRQMLINRKCALRGLKKSDPMYRRLVADMLKLQKILKELK